MQLRLAALLAAFIFSPALAQLTIQRPVNPAARNLTVQQMPDVATKSMTVEEARARIAKLSQEKRDLDAKLAEALSTIDSWTRKGGSLVHAYCESPTLAMRSDGAGQEDCSASGYSCSPSEGTCHRSCNITDECAGGWVCQTAEHVCVRV